MSKKITRTFTPEDTDLPPVSLDPTKSIAVITRRSVERKEVSLTAQDKLVYFAKLLQTENDEIKIRIYTDDGTPGTPEQTTNLMEDITNGIIGSIIVERPDRLFRSEQTLSMQVFQKQQILLIVPGKRLYDFNKEEDLQAFHANMQEAHEYIATHIKYMHDTHGQKRGRRERHTTTS